MRNTLLPLLILSVWMGANGASSPSDEPIQATLVTEAVVIDGILNESLWQRSADFDQPLITYSPAFGTEIPFKTELWLAYDQANLYFALRCEDRQADLIKTSMTKRDNIDNDDWVAVSLDTLGGRQGAYLLMVNPSGVQGDQYLTASGSDSAPDYVWHSAAVRIEKGYTVEIRLPLEGIRFRSGRDVELNLMLLRQVARLGLKYSWPAKRPSDSFLAVHRPVRYGELKRSGAFELIPSFTYGALWSRLSSDLWSGADDQADFGMTAKVGLSSAITMEATLNPDFSQVESDQMQVLVNQRYPLFYEEKRPFFMETGNLFNLAASDNSGDYNMFTAVHTRHIVDPIWGLKLTGEVGKAAFGVLAARDQWPEQTGEANATFALGRLKWNLGADNTAGLLFSGRSSANESNQALGFDLSYKLGGGHHLSAKFILSGQKKADSETLSDTSLTASWGYYTKPLSAFLVYEHVGEDFNMESAFMLRRGIRRVMGYLSPNLYPQNIPFITRLNLMLWGYSVHDYQTLGNDSLYFIALRTFFSKQAHIRIDWRRFNEVWAGTELGGDYLFVGGQVQLTNKLFLYASLDWGDKILYDTQRPQVGDGVSGTLVALVQPSEQLALELSYTYEQLKDPLNHDPLYTVHILSSKNTFQLNRFFFFRGIVQYDSSRKVVLSDLLASFTLIPETVIHLGYGSVHQKMDWYGPEWTPERRSERFYQQKQSLFFKASYRFRF